MLEIRTLLLGRWQIVAATWRDARWTPALPLRGEAGFFSRLFLVDSGIQGQ